MFHKNKEKLESFIGLNSNFKGDINTGGTLRIDGSMDGNVHADWVILSEKAHIKGDIMAKGIIIGGRIEGNLRAEEIVEIKSRGQVFGDIFANKLSIVEGGIFNGRASVERDESKVVELQAKKKNILILCAHYPFGTDASFGYHVFKALEKMHLPENLELMDIGEFASLIPHEIEGRDKLIVIDIFRTGDKPGTMSLSLPS